MNAATLSEADEPTPEMIEAGISALEMIARENDFLSGLIWGVDEEAVVAVYRAMRSAAKN